LGAGTPAGGPPYCGGPGTGGGAPYIAASTLVNECACERMKIVASNARAHAIVARDTSCAPPSTPPSPALTPAPFASHAAALALAPARPGARARRAMRDGARP